MKTKINTYLVALEERFANSRFQQAIYDWQDAHPIAATVLETSLHVAMWALCILLCVMLALFTVALVMGMRGGSAVRLVDVSFIAVGLIGVCLSINSLRNW